MTRVPINPGVVEWSGENPGMYLKESADGTFVTPISFFRVVLSPQGRGHGAFIVEAPQREGSVPDRLNVCVTDNEPLVPYLKDEFVAHFGPCRRIRALNGLRYEPGREFTASGHGRTVHSERFRAAATSTPRRPGSPPSWAWSRRSPR